MPLRVTKNKELQKLYPDEFPNQCASLKNTCENCGRRFPAGIIVSCPHCGTKRERCKNKSMSGEQVCRVHSVGRPYKLYTKIAAQLTDQSLQEYVEREDFDLTQEFVLARIALSGYFDQNETPNSEKMLDKIDTFFKIAQRKKKIEEGDIISLSWNDDLVVALKKRLRDFIRATGTVLKAELCKEFEVDEERAEYITTKVLSQVKETTKLMGNRVTAKPNRKERGENG